MYIGRGMYQKKMTRSEKWGIVKKVAYVTMATSFVALSVIGSLGVRHVKSDENKIRVIPGVGDKKIEKYGAELCQMLEYEKSRLSD